MAKAKCMVCDKKPGEDCDLGCGAILCEDCDVGSNHNGHCTRYPEPEDVKQQV